MVKQIDPYDAGDFLEALGDGQIGAAGFEGAAGVIVGDNDPGGSVADRQRKDFAGMHQRLVERPDENHVGVDDV